MKAPSAKLQSSSRIVYVPYPRQRAACSVQPPARSGATLLLALLILGGLVATSVTVATIVATQLRSGTAIDQAILAAYAAESGGEELLYAVRRAGRSGVAGEGTLGNGATWSRTVATVTPAVYAELERDGTEQLDLVPSSGELSATAIRTLIVTPRGDPDPGAWLEVTWVPWMLETGSWAPVTARTIFGPSDLQRDAPRTVDLHVIPGSTSGTPAAYRIRLRAIGAAVGRVQVEAATDASGSAKVPIPSRVRAVVTGTAGRARQAFAFEFPLRAPLASVFDAALSSECDIVKGDTIHCPTGQ